jgi:hypothetical protein
MSGLIYDTKSKIVATIAASRDEEVLENLSWLA